jgi:hypothetical protein
MTVPFGRLEIGKTVRFRVSRPGGVLVLTGVVAKAYDTTLLIMDSGSDAIYSVRKADVIGGAASRESK